MFYCLWFDSGFLDDIHDALNLCLHPDHGHEDEQYEDMLYLWYQLIDLLSIKVKFTLYVYALM